jgi:hypothetical protein
MKRDLISRNYVSWGLGNSITLRSQNRFAALENLNDSTNINRAWQNIKENIQTSAKECLGLYELKQHKPWFDDECSRFLDQRKKDKNAVATGSIPKPHR